MENPNLPYSASRVIWEVVTIDSPILLVGYEWPKVTTATGEIDASLKYLKVSMNRKASDHEKVVRCFDYLQSPLLSPLIPQPSSLESTRSRFTQSIVMATENSAPQNLFCFAMSLRILICQV
jgi:hypothetical protein